MFYFNFFFSSQLQRRSGHPPFKGLHPAIVDDTLFNSVQKRLDESTTDRFATYKDSPLLLLGLTRCGFCDHQLTTTYAQKKDGQRHFYYKCSTTSRFSESKCASRNLPAHELEDFTAKLLFHTATDNEFFEAVLKQVKGNAGGTLADKKNLRAELTTNHSTIKKQLKVVATNLTMMRLNSDTSAQIKVQIDTLNAQDKELDQQLRDIDRDIQTLENQQIDKKALREVFQEFARLYSDAPIDAKRKLLNVIIEEIRCSVKRGEKTGEITYKLRGDGTVKKAWEEAKKNEESSGPGNPGLTPRVAWLRDRLHTSNYILVKIPIEIRILGHGERLTCMDSERLPAELGLTDPDIQSLFERGLSRPRPQRARGKVRVDYEALRLTFHQMLQSGAFQSRAELARHLGVSRVWVSRVLKGIKKRPG